MRESLIRELDEFAAEHELSRAAAIKMLVREGLDRRKEGNSDQTRRGKGPAG